MIPVPDESELARAVGRFLVWLVALVVFAFACLALLVWVSPAVALTVLLTMVAAVVLLLVVQAVRWSR